MTEAGWLSRPVVGSMLEFIRGKATDRQLRLFACGCARQLWAFAPPNQASQRAVEAAETVADADAPVRKVRAKRGTVRNPEAATELGDAFAAASSGAAECVMEVRRHGTDSTEKARRGFELQYAQAELLRDIVGNPFRPVLIDPSSLTSTVVAIARGIYAEHAFDLLPILSDALMDAGCDHSLVLRHCRPDGVHARGCWLIDALMGKG